MKTYIVENQIAIAVVGINDEDDHIEAIYKFLKSQGIDTQEAWAYTRLVGGDQDGRWKNQHLEGTYVKRAFIV